MATGTTNSQSSTNKRLAKCCQNIGPSIKHFIQRLIYRKDINLVDADSHSEYKLRPGVLNMFHLVGIGLGGTIGTGIFVLSGHAAAQYAGPSVIISFLLAGIVALLAAFSYSEMASIIITPGSAYTYTYVALGEYPAFLIGWLSAFLYQFGASVAVVRWSRYVVHVTYVISGHNATQWLVHPPFIWSESETTFIRTGQILNLPAIAITLAITGLLIWGVRETATTVFVLVVVKLIALLIFIIAGSLQVDPVNYKPFIPSNNGTFNEFGFTGMLRGSTYVFYAYIAFETVSTASKESRKPTQYVPYATITALIISTVMYLGISTVMVGLVHYSELNIDIPMYAAVHATSYGLWFSIIMDFGAIASLTTVAITILYAQTRIFFTMARDGLLPKFFTRIQTNRKTPWILTLICGLICAIMSGFFPLDILGEIASIGALITFFVVHVCVIVIRYKHKAISRDFRGTFDRCPWLVPSIGALLCILLLIPVSQGTGIRFGIWMLIGHVAYFSYGFWHSKGRKLYLAHDNNSAINLVPMNDLSIETPMPHILRKHFSINEDEPSTPKTPDEGIASSVSELDQFSLPDNEEGNEEEKEEEEVVPKAIIMDSKEQMEEILF